MLCASGRVAPSIRRKALFDCGESCPLERTVSRAFFSSHARHFSLTNDACTNREIGENRLFGNRGFSRPLTPAQTRASRLRRVDAPDAQIAVRELEGIGRHVGFSRTALSVFSFVFGFRFLSVFLAWKNRELQIFMKARCRSFAPIGAKFEG